MRQNRVEVDIAAWKYVNLLENYFTIIFFISIFFCRTRICFRSQLATWHGSYWEKKNHHFCILIFISHRGSTITIGVSHVSSLLKQSPAGLESLGHMTWKILKQQLFCINIFMQKNVMMVPKSVSSDSAWGSGRWASVLLLLTLGEPQRSRGWTRVNIHRISKLKLTSLRFDESPVAAFE